MSLFRIPFYIQLTVYSYFSSHHLYNVTLVLHSVCLSKIFQRTFFRFGSESVCKDKGFIFNHQTFSKVFFEKVFFSLKTRLSFSLPCYYKVRYSKGFSYLLTQLQHVNLTALPLESGCKGTDFFHSCNSLNDFFSKKISLLA